MSAEPLETSTEPAALPYGFARRNGVMIEEGPDGAVCLHRR